MARNDNPQRRRVSAQDVRTNARESGGGSAKYFKLPAGVDLWYPPRVGSYSLDFFPYTIKSEHHPDRKGDLFGPGYLWWKYPYATHRNIGPANEEVLCLASFGQPCAVCEERTRLAKDYNNNEAAVKSLRSIRNTAYAIRNPDKTDQYAVFAYSNFKFGEVLDEELKQCPEEHLGFYDVTDAGRTMDVRFGEDTFEGRKFLKANRIDFKPRGAYDEDEVLAAVPCLDEIFMPLSPEALKKLFLQVGEGGASAPSAGGATNTNRAPGAPKAPTTQPAPATPSGSTSKTNAAPGSAPGGKGKAPGAAPSKPPAPQAGQAHTFKDDDRVQWEEDGDSMVGTVVDTDDNTISIKGDNGQEYDIAAELVTLVPATAGGGKKRDKKTAAPATPPAAVELKVGLHVIDDMENNGVITKINGDQIKFQNPETGNKHTADRDDVKPYTPPETTESQEAAEGAGNGDSDGGEGLAVGTPVSFPFKGKTLTGTVESIDADDEDCVVLLADGKKQTVDLSDVTVLEGDNGDGDDDGGSAPREWLAGDKVRYKDDDGDDAEGRITKVHSSKEKVKVETPTGEVWVPVNGDLKLVPKK